MEQQGRSAHGDLSDQELDDALAEIQSGSDRVAAIMGGALVQSCLMGALVHCFERQADLDRVFDSVRGPLNTFYSQTVMAQALGLIDDELAQAVQTIRSIRNEFAHAATSLNFDNPALVKKCESLSKYREEGAETGDKSDARVNFEHACYEHSARLIAAGSRKLHEYADALKHKVAFDMMTRTNELASFPGLDAASAKGGDKNA